MSVTSTEVNYLIWRYLQETGLEISAFALQDETKVNEYDNKYKETIPIGCLVNLLQKGILYCQDDELVADNGELISEHEAINKFTLFGALNYDKIVNPNIEPVDSFKFKNDEDQSMQTEEYVEKDADDVINVDGALMATQSKEDSDDNFIRVINKSISFVNSVTCSWNTLDESVIAYGLKDSSARISSIAKGSDMFSSSITMVHPMDASITPTNTHHTDITTIGWSPSGGSLLTASHSGELRLWTLDGKLRNVGVFHNSPIWFIKWSDDGAYILTVDCENRAVIWDGTTCNLLQSYVGSSSIASSTLDSTKPAENYGVDACWIDNTKFAIPGRKYAILIYSVGEKNAVGYLEGHTNTIGCMNYNRDMHLLASGSDDKTIRIWKGNSSSCAKLLTGHTQPIISVNWLEYDAESKSSYLLSTSMDGSIRVWDIKTGEIVLLSILDGLPIFSAATSPDFKWLATGNSEGLVTVWNVSQSSIAKAVKDNQVSNKPGSIMPVGEFQPDVDETTKNLDDQSGSSVTNISWNKSSTKICISYAGMESIIVNWS